MNHFGLAIDPATNDLFLRADGSLAVVQDAEAVGQHVRQRLKTFEGEWFLDRTAGVEWLDQIIGADYNPSLAEALVKAEILDTHGVTGISEFDVGFSRVTRELRLIGIDVLTVYQQEVRV